jgi:ribosomal protein S6--L-glutamate ligase
MDLRIITDNRSFFEQYEDLVPGDIVVGRIRLHPGEEHILLDLLAREITLIPSATSQLLSRSKVFQARILHSYMIPGTRAVYSIHDLMHTVADYGARGEGKVVGKLDRANGGMGILLYASMEEIYSQAVLGTLSFPFVVQPYMEGGKDIRVVMLGEYMEAYRRHNPNNFRHNLHCGGKSSPWELTGKQVDLCRGIIQRGDFPYGHIDLLITPSGETWLHEINLRGGLKGAKISQEDYLKKVEAIHASMLDQLQGGIPLT